MASFKNLKDLEAYLRKQITDSLKDDVAVDTIRLLQGHISDDIYSAYTPYSSDGKTPHYERTYKLLTDIENNMIDENTLEIKSTRKDEKTGRDIMPILEYGKGYEWGYSRDLDEEIGERPAIANTKEDLKDEKAKEYVKKALQRRLGKNSVR